MLHLFYMIKCLLFNVWLQAFLTLCFCNFQVIFDFFILIFKVFPQYFLVLFILTDVILFIFHLLLLYLYHFLSYLIVLKFCLASHLLQYFWVHDLRLWHLFLNGFQSLITKCLCLLVLHLAPFFEHPDPFLILFLPLSHFLPTCLLHLNLLFYCHTLTFRLSLNLLGH